MKKTDLAYIAGFFDGEGCISIKRLTNRDRPYIQYQLEVTIGSTDEWACRRLLFMFKGNVRKIKNQNPKWKPFWVWRASSKTAGEFLQMIFPYLHLKRDRAEIALKFQEARSSKRDRFSLTENEMALEEVQRILIAKSNHRGNSAYQDVVGNPETGQIIVSKGIDPDVKETIKQYRKLSYP